MATYLAAGFVFAVVMLLINDREQRGAREQGSPWLPVAVYVLVGLAWPVSAAAFLYGVITHLIRRTSVGGEPTP